MSGDIWLLCNIRCGIIQTPALEKVCVSYMFRCTVYQTTIPRVASYVVYIQGFFGHLFFLHLLINHGTAWWGQLYFHETVTSAVYTQVCLALYVLLVTLNYSAMWIFHQVTVELSVFQRDCPIHKIRGTEKIILSNVDMFH